MSDKNESIYDNVVSVTGFDLPDEIKLLIAQCLKAVTGNDVEVRGIAAERDGTYTIHTGDRPVGKSPALAAPFSDDDAETREINANMLFVVHELKAGRALPKDWESRDFVRKAILSYATDLGMTNPMIASAEFTEEQLEGMKTRLEEYHSTGARGLSFNALRTANLERCPMFKNAKGEDHRNGSPWSLADWMVATFGELGEAANVMKKVRRGDFSLNEARDKLAQEFSDVVIYMDLMASEMGINLGEAVLKTFNAKSTQLELSLYLTEDGYQHGLRK